MHITLSRFKETIGLNNSLSTMATCRQSLLFDKQSTSCAKRKIMLGLRKKRKVEGLMRVYVRNEITLKKKKKKKLELKICIG